MEIRDLNTPEAMERVYQNAMILYEGNLYTEAAAEFARIPDYKDAAAKSAECLGLIETAKKDSIYAEADKAAGNNNVKSQEKAIKIFKTIPGWRDADERVKEAENRIKEIIAKEKTDREEAIRDAQIREEKAKERKKRILRIAIVAVLSAAACFACVFLFKKYAVPVIQYRRGAAQMEAGNYDEAYRMLHDLEIRDSSDLIAKMAIDRLKTAEIGSTVQFGYFPQSSKKGDTEDPIDWIVLDRDGSKVLLISKYALNCLQYHGYYESLGTASWKTSIVRSWLNNEFLEKAFDSGEAALIAKTIMQEEEGENRYRLGRDASGDKVFLLSTSEADKYFATDEARKCLPTKYAIGRGVYQSSIGRTCFWWLRSTMWYTDYTLEGRPSTSMVRAALVGTNGGVVEVGHYVFNRQYAVRPAIWVNTESSGN